MRMLLCMLQGAEVDNDEPGLVGSAHHGQQDHCWQAAFHWHKYVGSCKHCCLPYTHIVVHTSSCMHVRSHIWKFMHTHMRACTHTHTHTHTHKHKHTHTHRHTHTHTHKHTHTHTHTHTHIHKYIHTYMCTRRHSHPCFHMHIHSNSHISKTVYVNIHCCRCKHGICCYHSMVAVINWGSGLVFRPGQITGSCSIMGIVTQSR